MHIVNHYIRLSHTHLNINIHIYVYGGKASSRSLEGLQAMSLNLLYYLAVKTKQNTRKQTRIEAACKNTLDSQFAFATIETSGQLGNC